MIYSLDRGRCLLVLFAISVNWELMPSTLSCIVQDVPLQRRFPCWCCPIISFLVHNFMWLRDVPHDNGSRQCPRVTSPAPAQTDCEISNTQSRFHCWCEDLSAPRAPGVIWSLRRHSAWRRVYLKIKPQNKNQSSRREPESIVTKLLFITSDILFFSARFHTDHVDLEPVRLGVKRVRFEQTCEVESCVKRSRWTKRNELSPLCRI